MFRVTIILTALAVSLSNALCACGGGIANAATSRAAASATDTHCGDDDCCGVTDRDGDRHDANHGTCPDKDHHDGHSCGHCTGAVTVESAVGKDLTAHDFAGAAALTPFTGCSQLSIDAADEHARHFNDGLPPPVPRPTLLNLSCLLTI
jgi:hypothetical protein